MEADLIEEIARIYGYHNLPSKLDFAQVDIPRQLGVDFELEREWRHFLAARGWVEVYTYSMVSESESESNALFGELRRCPALVRPHCTNSVQLGTAELGRHRISYKYRVAEGEVGQSEDAPLGKLRRCPVPGGEIRDCSASGKLNTKVLRIANPLTDDRVVLRQSLIPSLQEVWAQNVTQRGEVNGVFELARVYFPGKTQAEVRQPLKLGLMTTLPYREVRALVEQMLGLVYVRVEVTAAGVIKAAASGEREWVELGQVWVLADGKVAVELDVATGVQLARPFPQLEPMRKGVEIIEDMTFVIESGEIGGIIKKIYQVSSLIKKVQLKDIYQNHYTFSLNYQDRERPLSSEELRPVRLKLVERLARAGVKLVGEIK
jgi:phenylalanyl-tRNA synthetase beta subunit